MWRGGGGNSPRPRRWLELGDDGWGGLGGSANVERARSIDGSTQKKNLF
jgi:hypothetical protein